MIVFNSILCVPSVKSHFMVIVITKERDWPTVRLIIMRYVQTSLWRRTKFLKQEFCHSSGIHVEFRLYILVSFDS